MVWCFWGLESNLFSVNIEGRFRNKGVVFIGEKIFV